MDAVESRLLDALRCAVRGEAAAWDEPLSRAEQTRLFRLAAEHHVVPLVAEAVYGTLEPGSPFRRQLVREARKLTVWQARRTAEFLLLYEELGRQGLQPAVMKGVVCRDLYPQPEQRPSEDEDLLVSDEEFPRLHRALIACGFRTADPGVLPEEADEVSYLDESRALYLEVHKRLFASDSDAYGDCNAPFAGALERTVTVQIGDMTVRTLAPTDHLLFLLCHAYKHFLHGGVGIRQLCDIGLFAERYAQELDWAHIVSACRELHIAAFCGALLRIGERYLGFAMPGVFADYDGDVAPLLEDILSGGLYGVEDINRAHSSTLTLDAVEADRTGRRRGGALRSVFLPANQLAGRYTYLRQRPWLLPVAWGQRIWGYVTEKRRKTVKPTETLRIGRERIALLRQYGIID